MKVVQIINLLLTIAWALIVYQTLPSEQSVSPNWFFDAFIAASFLLLQLLYALRAKAFYGFILVMQYALALVIGMRLMLSLDTILSLAGFGLFLLKVFAIIYLIGVRGFLRSPEGRQVMGVVDQ